MCKGSLSFSVASYFPKARFLHMATNNQLLHYSHAYQLNDRANIETMNAQARAYYGTSERCENESVFTLERL